MLKTVILTLPQTIVAYHLGEGRVLKTRSYYAGDKNTAYHLGEGRVLKTSSTLSLLLGLAYHLGEGRVLKTCSCR